MFSSIKNNVMIFLVLAVITCGAYSYHQHGVIGDNETKIATLNKDVADGKLEIDKLKEKLEKKHKSDEATEKTVATVTKNETNIVSAKTQAAVYVDNKLAAIEKKYADKEKTIQNQQAKETEVSLERAKGMWLAFCLQEPAAQTCH